MQEPVSLLKTAAKPSMRPFLETKQTRHIEYTCVLTSLETFHCILEVSIREHGGEECSPQKAAQKREQLLDWQEVTTPHSVGTWV